MRLDEKIDKNVDLKTLVGSQVELHYKKKYDEKTSKQVQVIIILFVLLQINLNLN